MSRRPNSRDDILAAAEAIVCEQGAAHLTLDAVAERAGISKGGLLYNFPTKEALLRAMLARLLEQCDADCSALRAGTGIGTGTGTKAPPPDAGGKAEDPVAGLKAYVEVGFRKAADRRQVSAALLAAGANDPRLLSPVRDWHRGHFEQFSAGKRHPLRVLLVMLAMDGLWLNELLQTSAVEEGERDLLRRELLALADSAV